MTMMFKCERCGALEGLKDEWVRLETMDEMWDLCPPCYKAVKDFIEKGEKPNG